MIRLVGAALLVALGFVAAPAPALAQEDTLGAAALKMYEGCRTGQNGSSSECACVAGIFGGRMKEDEYKMLAAITRFIGPGGAIADMAGAQAEAEAERVRQNMTQTRFGEVMASFVALGEMGPYADRICMPLANK